MDMSRCYICKDKLDYDTPSSYISVDFPDIMARICRECNTELNGKVALIAEVQGMRTGEVVFLSRRVLDLTTDNNFPNEYCIYLVPPDTLKILVKRILKLNETKL